jgi:hypothetical protein
VSGQESEDGMREPGVVTLFDESHKEINARGIISDDVWKSIRSSGPPADGQDQPAMIMKSEPLTFVTSIQQAGKALQLARFFGFTPEGERQPGESRVDHARRRRVAILQTRCHRRALRRARRLR